MSKPIIAVVGRPNVGQSTLFNKLIGQRLAIVEDTPGVTRDRIYCDGEWRNKAFTLIDTGGFEPFSDDTILKHIRTQAEIAIDTADVIILVTDVKSGVTANDIEVANILKKSGRPVLLCVNKCDKIGDPEPEFYEFYNLGLGDPIAVSAAHGHGTGDLLDEAFKYLPKEAPEQEDEERIKVAIVGRPNAGKSSLVNKIIGENRMIVSDIAGTTRDAVDMPFDKDGKKYLFIDTAGIRRKSKINDAIEKFSVIRAENAIDRADVCVIMIDAQAGFAEQDSKIAGLAHDKGKGCIVCVNKWDLVDKDTNTMNSFRKKLENDFSFMAYVPFIFISAKSGQRVDRLFELIHYVAEQNAMRIKTGMLNDVLSDATSRVQPPSDKGKRLKIYYITQASTKPPTFVCFVNSSDLFHFSYQRYIENRIRETFGMEGTPIRFVIREKSDKDK